MKTEINEAAFASWKYQATRKQGLYVRVDADSMSSNWDGSSWTAWWSDGDMDYIKTSTNKRFDGLRYCRSKATETAWRERYERDVDAQVAAFVSREARSWPS